MTEALPPPAEAEAAAPRRLVRIALRWLRAGPEVTGLVAVAFAVRLAAIWVSPAIANDSASLLRGADRVVREGPAVLLDLPHHPGPVALFAGLAALGLPDVAAAVACAALGAAVVWPLHALARRACGRHAATAAGIVYAALPKAVDVSALPLTEAPYLLCLLGALALAAAARDAGPRASRRLAGAGIVAGLAFLCRPEGLLAFPAAAAAAGLDGRPGRVKRTGLVLAGFLLLAVPYVGLLSHTRGRFTLTPKKDVLRFAGIESPVPGRPTQAAPVPPPTEPGAEEPSVVLVRTIRGTASALESAFTVPVGVLVLLGLLSPRRWRRRRARRPRLLLTGTATVLLILLLRLQAGWGYASGRHALGIAVLLLPFVGQGLATLGVALRRTTSRRRVAITLAWALAIPLTVRVLVSPPGASGLAARRLGERIAADLRAPSAPARARLRIASVAEPLVAFYADRAGPLRVDDLPLWGRFVRPLERGADPVAVVDALLVELRSSAVDYVVLDITSASSRTLGEQLVARGVLGLPAVAAGSELAAFRVLPR